MGPIIGTVLLAGLNPIGEPKYINGTYLVAALDADGQPHILEVDANGDLIVSGGSSGGAPVAAQYVVGAAHADLSAEILTSTLIGTGTDAAKPAANAVPAGALYFSTDINGGTLYRSDASTWSKVGLGLTEGPVLLATASPTGTNFDFTGIPVTYKHLNIIFQARGDTAANSTPLIVKLNNDGGANYDYVEDLLRSGAQGSTESIGATAIALAARIAAATTAASYASGGNLWIPNYSGTAFYKTLVTLSAYVQPLSATNFGTSIVHGIWKSTAAIDRVTGTLTAGNFVSGSYFELWGYR